MIIYIIIKTKKIEKLKINITKMKKCLCGKSFKLNGSLYNHIKNKHEGKYQEYKMSNTKRGRPKKPITENPKNNKYKDIKYTLDIDMEGKELVKVFDRGLLVSATFRKLISSFSELHPDLIYERQINSCDYSKFSEVFRIFQNNEEVQKFCVEIAAFAQMLQPDQQQEILEYVYDYKMQKKKENYSISLQIQTNLSQILQDVYGNINIKNNHLESNNYPQKLDLNFSQMQNKDDMSSSQLITIEKNIILNNEQSEKQCYRKQQTIIFSLESAF
ncbi:hypothetical protein ABPG74_001271 [Tetrahymena malaccensis]